MSIRRRDRIRNFLGRTDSLLAARPRAGTKDNAQAPIVAPQLDDTAQTFLANTLDVLTPHEQSLIRGHVIRGLQGIDGVVQASLEAAHAQKRRCEAKQWPWTEKADKLVLWLDRFKSVGDIIANIDPIHVGLPWAGVRILLEATASDSHQMRALLDGMSLALSTAHRLRAYFAYYRRLPPNALTTRNFEKALVVLYAHILRFLATAIEIYAKNTVVRKFQALWQLANLVAFENQCDTLGSRVEVEASNCDRDLDELKRQDLAIWKAEIDKTLQQLDKILEISDTLKTMNVKVDLSKLQRVGEATYNSSEEGQLSKCLEGTRPELLDQIIYWANAPDSKCIFWLCGKAGTGKSTISRTVAERLHRQQRLGASFFFKRGEGDRSDASRFFATIVAQLTDCIPAMRLPVAEALDRDTLLCSRSLQEQFDKLLMQPLLGVPPAQLPRSGLTIVIDALDECERNMDVRLFLRLLSQVHSSNALRLTIFATSRPELPVLLGFRQLNGDVHEDVVLELVQGPTIPRDIRQFFVHRLTEIREEYNMPHRCPVLDGRASQSVVQG